MGTLPIFRAPPPSLRLFRVGPTRCRLKSLKAAARFSVEAPPLWGVLPF